MNFRYFSNGMRSLIFMSCVTTACVAVPKPHVVSFGKWTSAKWLSASGEKQLDLKVRALFVDTKLKEYTIGAPHEITDRLFAVRRAFRVNDALPIEMKDSFVTPRWQWQRGRMAAGGSPKRPREPDQPA